MAYICNTKKYTDVLISSIFFDENIRDMVENNGGTFPHKLVCCLYSTNTYPLDQKRLDSVITGWQNGLPPISVKELTPGMFHLLNGRHRVAASILKGVDSIPVSENET
jgi:hypothetical protein